MNTLFHNITFAYYFYRALRPIYFKPFGKLPSVFTLNLKRYAALQQTAVLDLCLSLDLH